MSCVSPKWKWRALSCKQWRAASLTKNDDDEASVAADESERSFKCWNHKSKITDDDDEKERMRWRDDTQTLMKILILWPPLFELSLHNFQLSSPSVIEHTLHRLTQIEKLKCQKIYFSLSHSNRIVFIYQWQSNCIHFFICASSSTNMRDKWVSIQIFCTQRMRDSEA